MEEIEKIVRSASLRDRALVLFSLSSGLARNEIMNLTYKDFLTAINAPLSTPVEEVRDKINKDTIPQFLLMREKTSFEFVTFCSPEACTAILDYLENRKVKSEWLFTNDKGGKLKDRTYEAIFQRLNDRNGLGYKKNDKSRRLTSHQMRRVFATQLLSVGIPKTSIDFMMAHSIGPVSSAYFKLNPEALKREYIKGLDAITIEKINVIDFESEEVQKMREQMKEMDIKMEQQAKELELQKNIMKEIQRFGKLPK
jgi:integrase